MWQALNPQWTAMQLPAAAMAPGSDPSSCAAPQQLPRAPAACCLQVLQPMLSSALFRVYTPLVRGVNNLAGGMTYVMLVKALGVQKAAKEE